MNGPSERSPARVLVLARLLAAGPKGESRDKIGKDLGPLLESAGAGRLDEALAGLESDGALRREESGARKKTARYGLTEGGRRLALGALGLEDLPARTTWAKVQSDYLAPLALGRPGRKGADLKAEILRAHYGLEIKDQARLKDAADAMAARLLGLGPGRAFTIEAVLRKLLADAGIELAPAAKKADAKAIGEALFRRELGDPSARKPLDLLATRAVGARQDRPAELATAILKGWAGGPAAPSNSGAEAGSGPGSSPAPLDLPNFARRVAEAARRSMTGRFGESKVFISHVRRALAEASDFPAMNDATFKGRLIEAHLAGLIELGRADLVDAMDPADVHASATPYLNAVYHFVRIEDHRR